MAPTKWRNIAARPAGHRAVSAITSLPIQSVRTNAVLVRAVRKQVIELGVAEAAPELIDLTRRIQDLLFACIEGVALCAYLDLQLICAISRACLKAVPAAAAHRYLVIFGMYASFHFRQSSKIGCWNDTEDRSVRQGSISVMTRLNST